MLAGSVALALLSLGPVADTLALAAQDGVEPLPPERLAGIVAAPGGPGAIVVLGGGLRLGAREDGEGVAPASYTLERLVQGARLARASGLPLLVTGGAERPGEPTEARTMQRVLERDFGVSVRWVEDRARDTAENADRSAELLGAAGIHRIVLVTSAFHQTRANAEFRRAGFDVTPAPTAFGGGGEPVRYAWLPRAGALRRSSDALHEMLGRAWARVRA